MFSIFKDLSNLLQRIFNVRLLSKAKVGEFNDRIEVRWSVEQVFWFKISMRNVPTM